MSMKPLPDALKLAHLYLVSLHDEAESRKQREKLRDQLKPYILEECEPDENGNFIYEFPSPIQIDGIWYKGLMTQRKVSEFVSEEKLREIIALHSLEDRCVKTVTYTEVDLDEVYAANQEGIISDDEIDSVLETTVNYALTKVKA